MSDPVATKTGKVMLLTAPGPAAIAVVRVVGAETRAFLTAHFSGTAREGGCVHGNLLATDGRAVDDAVVMLHPGGQRADLNVHGGPWVVETMLALAVASGFERVDPANDLHPGSAQVFDGENTLECEMLAALPRAATVLAIRALLAQPTAWHRWVGSRPGAASIREVLADCWLRRLIEPARVAIVGLANVGKSTLANALFARQRSITADMPGTTRDWVGELANLDGVVVMLLDTPGVRSTSDLAEREAIERARRETEGADVVVVVLDGSAPLKEQSSLLHRYPRAIVVVNKADRKAEFDPPSVHGIPTTATTGGGIDALRQAIRSQLGVAEPLDVDRPGWWTERQRGLLSRAMDDPGALACILDEP